jgi:hypothetical protein
MKASLQTPLSQPESKMLIVDRQGRGDYTSIAEAIAQAPEGLGIIQKI